MSSSSGHFDCEQLSDAAAYALGALEEADAYRDHLEDCSACRDEVARLQVAVDTLPATVPQVHAPRALHDRVLATVRAEAELLQAATSPAERPANRRGARWRTPRLSFAAAAAVLAIAVAATLVIASSVRVSRHETVTSAAISIPGAHGSLREIDDRGELVVSNMPEPPLGRIYEVWLRRGPKTLAPTNALFSVSSRGGASVAVPGSLHGVNEVLVTSEPLGGSAHPTSSPVLRVAVSS
jgi:hypothetical protein